MNDAFTYAKKSVQGWKEDTGHVSPNLYFDPPREGVYETLIHVAQMALDNPKDELMVIVRAGLIAAGYIDFNALSIGMGRSKFEEFIELAKDVVARVYSDRDNEEKEDTMKIEDIKPGDLIRFWHPGTEEFREATVKRVNLNSSIPGGYLVTAKSGYAWDGITGVELLERPKNLPTEDGYYMSREVFEDNPPAEQNIYLRDQGEWYADTDVYHERLQEDDLPGDLVKLVLAS